MNFISVFFWPFWYEFYICFCFYFHLRGLSGWQNAIIPATWFQLSWGITRCYYLYLVFYYYRVFSHSIGSRFSYSHGFSTLTIMKILNLAKIYLLTLYLLFSGSKLPYPYSLDLLNHENLKPSPNICTCSLFALLGPMVTVYFSHFSWYIYTHSLFALLGPLVMACFIIFYESRPFGWITGTGFAVNLYLGLEFLMF